MMAAAICRHVGARNVVISDLNDYRLDLAKKLGATRTVRADKEDLRDVMHELGMRRASTSGWRCQADPQAFSGMVDVIRNSGKIALLGLS